jgi:hypothetical protein
VARSPSSLGPYLATVQGETRQPNFASSPGNPVLATRTVLSPHTPDEGPQLGGDRRPAHPTARAPTPPHPPCRSMPPENRRGKHNDHGLESHCVWVASVAISRRSSRRSRGRGDERQSSRFSAVTTARGANDLKKAATALRRRWITERSSTPRSRRSSASDPRTLNGPRSEFLQRTASAESHESTQTRVRMINGRSYPADRHRDSLHWRVVSTDVNTRVPCLLPVLPLLIAACFGASNVDLRRLSAVRLACGPAVSWTCP